MSKSFPRRLVMIVLTSAIVGIFATVAVAGRAVTAPQVLLALSSFVFCYIVVRLSETMLVADPEKRRHARRRLILAATVPALVLTPAAVESSAEEYRLTILFAGIIWLALAMAYTSFLLARAAPETLHENVERPRPIAQIHRMPGEFRRYRPHPHKPRGAA